MESTFHAIVLAQCMSAAVRMTKHALGLARKRADRAARGDRTTACDLVRDAAHCSTSNRWNGFQQMPGRRIAVKRARDLTYAFGQPRCRLGDRPRDLRQQLSRQRCCCLCHHRKQLAGCHTDEREEVFCSLVLGFGLCRKLPEVLHHRVGIDLADGADLVLELFLMLMFVLVLHFLFHLFFAEQASDHIADGAEPAFAFQAGLVFHLFFELFLKLVLVFGKRF
jgi:hypothetical protein